MTTFQAIVYGIIHGFTEFLPVSADAHHVLVSYLLGWPQPTGVFLGALSLGALFSVFIYFIHDWAAIISTFIQVIVYRKKPMTLDERLPIFITISTLPAAAGWYYLREPILEFFTGPLWVAAGLAVFGVPLWFADSMSRKTKGMFDWNWRDTLTVGLGQALLLVPGAGRTAGALTGALFRNYNREPAVKYCFLLAAPILLGSVSLHLREVTLGAHSPAPDLSWLTFVITVVITALTGLLAIGYLMKNAQKKGFREYALYRFFLAGGVTLVYWLTSAGILG